MAKNQIISVDGALYPDDQLLLSVVDDDLRRRGVPLRAAYLNSNQNGKPWFPLLADRTDAGQLGRLLISMALGGFGCPTVFVDLVPVLGYPECGSGRNQGEDY
jgi:hypothetical protein